jgi:5-bromo-4-chloroindolyl phosphate hydrolysis protein
MGHPAWEIIRNEDGTFDIHQKGELLRSSIPARWLEDELAKHGLCGQEYRNIRQQLDETGRAEIAL